MTSDRSAFGTLPAPQLLAGSGAVGLLEAVARLRSRRLRWAVALLPLLAGGVEATRFVERYAGTYREDAAPYFNAGYGAAIQTALEEAPPGAPLLVARPEDWRVERYALNPYVHSLVLFYTRRPPEAWQAGGGLGRFDVVRVPEQGTIHPRDLPAGSWAVLPADRVDLGEAHRVIRSPAGRSLVAVLSAGPAG